MKLNQIIQIQSDYSNESIQIKSFQCNQIIQLIKQIQSNNLIEMNQFQCNPPIRPLTLIQSMGIQSDQSEGSSTHPTTQENIPAFHLRDKSHISFFPNPFPFFHTSTHSEINNKNI